MVKLQSIVFAISSLIINVSADQPAAPFPVSYTPSPLNVYLCQTFDPVGNTYNKCNKYTSTVDKCQAIHPIENRDPKAAKWDEIPDVKNKILCVQFFKDAQCQQAGTPVNFQIHTIQDLNDYTKGFKVVYCMPPTYV